MKKLALVLGVVLGALATVSDEGVSASSTFMVTSTSCTGPGSITEAVAAANANPGVDTIEFTPGLRVSADIGSCGVVRWIAEVTESVIFKGNGARLVGAIQWVTSGGLNTPLDRCPREPDLVTAVSPGFLVVGGRGSSAAGVEVEVRGLGLESLNDIAFFDSDGGSLLLEDVTATRILSHQFSCAASAIQMGGKSDLTLRRNSWNQVYNWGISIFPPLLTNQAIQNASGGGNLVIENSDFAIVGNETGLVAWSGATGTSIDIVSTRLRDAGGIVTFGESTTNIVNSVWALTGPPDLADRIINRSSGPMNIEASTVMAAVTECDSACVATNAAGVVRQWEGGGPINLIESAIGVNLATVSTGPLLVNADRSASGGFSADTNTWVQPVPDQDAAALKTLTGQPGLLTDASGLPTFSGASSLEAYVSPLLGTTADPAQLIDKIPDSACGGTNQLTSPIDGTTCIDTDAFGNSRWDTGNEARNIGAVQLTLAPRLSVVATGDETVDLGWNRPLDGSGDSVTGYVVRYRAAGSSGPFTEQSVNGPDSLAAQVAGLTNGTQYEFEVAAVRSTAGVGPASNLDTGTPYGPIGAPAVTAENRDGEITLFWTEPPSGGHPGPLYYTVVYRPVGEPAWSAGPGFLSARTTTIPGLETNTTYEFGVYATAVDQVSGPIGTATATTTPPTASTTTTPTASTTTTPTASTTTTPTASTTTTPTASTTTPASTSTTTISLILPETGTGTGSTAFIAALFAAAGVVLVLTARRRTV